MSEKPCLHGLYSNCAKCCEIHGHPGCACAPVNRTAEEDLKAAREFLPANLQAMAVALARFRAQAREAAYREGVEDMREELEIRTGQFRQAEKERDEARAEVAQAREIGYQQGRQDEGEACIDFGHDFKALRERAEAAEARLREVSEEAHTEHAAFRLAHKAAEKAEAQVRELRAALAASHAGYHFGYVSLDEAAHAGCKVCALLARTETSKDEKP